MIKFFRFVTLGPTDKSHGYRIASIPVRALFWIIVIFGFGRVLISSVNLIIQTSQDMKVFRVILPNEEWAKNFEFEIYKRQLNSYSLFLREIIPSDSKKIQELYHYGQTQDLTPDQQATLAIGVNIYGKPYEASNIADITESLSKLDAQKIQNSDFINNYKYDLLAISLENLSLIPSNIHVSNGNVFMDAFFYTLFGNQGVRSNIPHIYDYDSANKIINAAWPTYISLKDNASIDLKRKVEVAYSIYLISRYSKAKYENGYPGSYVMERCDDNLEKLRFIIESHFDEFKNAQGNKGFKFNHQYKVTRQTFGYDSEKAEKCNWL